MLVVKYILIELIESILKANDDIEGVSWSILADW
jgi:hypothetical protein